MARKDKDNEEIDEAFLMIEGIGRPRPIEDEEDEDGIPLERIAKKRNKKRKVVYARGGGMIGKNKLIKGYKKGGQV